MRYSTREDVKLRHLCRYEHYLEKNLSISDTRLLSSCHPITVTMDLRQTSAQNILVLHFNSNCDKKVLRGWCLCWSRAFVTVAYIHQSKLCWVKLNSRFQTTCHSISVARYNLRDCQACFFQAEDGIRARFTWLEFRTCALPISVLTNLPRRSICFS